MGLFRLTSKSKWIQKIILSISLRVMIIKDLNVTNNLILKNGNKIIIYWICFVDLFALLVCFSSEAYISNSQVLLCNLIGRFICQYFTPPL